MRRPDRGGHSGGGDDPGILKQTLAGLLRKLETLPNSVKGFRTFGNTSESTESRRQRLLSDKSLATLKRGELSAPVRQKIAERGESRDAAADLFNVNRQRIFDMWLAGYTDDEIATATELKKSRIHELAPVLDARPKPEQVVANFTDADWTPPLFNIWTFAKKSNDGTYPVRCAPLVITRQNRPCRESPTCLLYTSPSPRDS